MLLPYQLQKLSADSAVASYAEEAPTSLRVWREACQADDADLDTLSAVLGTFTNTVEILECIVTMPVSLGHVLWIDCTAAALMILEKRGIGQEDIVTGDTVGMEQMFTSGDRLVTEQERLMGTDAPLLTEGMVYMYLVNRLSVLNAYIMALSQVRKPRNIDAPTIAQQWHDLFSEIDFGEGPLNPPVAALARVSTKSGRDQKQPEMPLPEFLSYFDMLSKAAKIVKVDEKLSEFICHSLTEGSIDIFANCAHILSLDNSLVLQMVVLWGAKPRSVRSTMPVDNFSRLVGAPVAEQVADDVPEWLLSMSGRDSLLHAAYIIAAARKRLIETDPDVCYTAQQHNSTHVGYTPFRRYPLYICYQTNDSTQHPTGRLPARRRRGLALPGSFPCALDGAALHWKCVDSGMAPFLCASRRFVQCHSLETLPKCRKSSCPVCTRSRRRR